MIGLKFCILILLYYIFVRGIYISSSSAESFNGNSPNKVSYWNFEDKKLYYVHPEEVVLSAVSNTSVLVEWGQTIPADVTGQICTEGDQCYDYGIAKVVINNHENCQKVEWTTSQLEELKDCINLIGHWYGGGQQHSQPWPIEKNPRIEVPFTTADVLQGTHQMYGGVSERYWVSSSGVAIRVNDTIPLFLSIIDSNEDGIADKMCFAARYDAPYSVKADDTCNIKMHDTPCSVKTEASNLKLAYTVCYADDIKQVYEATYNKFFSTPTNIPDETMLTHPVWSSWAEYKTEVNDTRIINLAKAIKYNGFNSSQIEIDDNWETCYGDATFNQERFPNPRATVDTLHSMGFRVTLWIHPFINNNCKSFSHADANGYLIKNSQNQTQLTYWWQGDNNAGLIDFTNEDAVAWWTSRLETIKLETGMDSFKFDAGEVSWLPTDYTLNLNEEYWPNGYTTAFVDAVSQFGNLIEVRVGHSTQSKPVFVRMLDKDSHWENTNGLATMIPSLLHSSIIGYPFVLPDMIGGNAYLGQPDAELFIRWAQSNTFMPGLQFSILPWNYNESVVNISKEVTSLHVKYAPYIIELAKNLTRGEGDPLIMKPTWWLCPLDENCLTADQQFLVGNDLLVAPIVEKGASSKTVIFPPGLWKYLGDKDIVYSGPKVVTINNLNIKSNIYFTRA